MTEWEKKIELSEIREQQEQDELKRRQWKARLYAARREKQQYKLDHSKGYCPICHMLRALDGSCSC